MRLDWGSRRIDGVDFQSSITEDERARLTELARGKHVLEIGSAYGYTTCFMAQVAEQVLAVDPHRGYGAMPHSLPVMNANVTALKIRNIDLRITVSQDLLPQLISAGEQFDLVFVDGDHRYASAQFDLDHGWWLVAPGGTMAVHDYGEITCPQVIPAVDDWVAGVGDWDATDLTDTLWQIHKKEAGHD